jgi:RimJ/RimL family protein N-acetyltransferase
MDINTKNPILIDIPMPIVTPRLIIRPVMPGDGVEIHEALSETWDQIHRWMPLWAKELSPVDHYEEIVRKAYAKFILREDFMMIALDRETRQPVILTGIHRFDWNIRRFEIGYWCRKTAQGRGLVTENTNALARYAFHVLKARTVAITHAHDNHKSQAVIERLGFHYEGTLKNALVTGDGILHDDVWYSHIRIDDLPPLDIQWGKEP